ncbi:MULTISPECIES: cysteine desulfurase [Glycomyces]|uniref:Cysteine desulfurase n=2 Tax=Glycomyces TaxID=58113 RepID=A0A9X3T9X6_9ACTN|nr:cysteine desulfurase [Glycomyces lechevalierae]MDA1387013.1 cysteine desulfurase [Glycomyces lechevalierae]MDR7336958.1 cysteine desulfurase/selenocysteine lyase [Glycomyces lechevalierae]
MEAASKLDVEAIRADFPILQRRIGDKTLAYLDSAATSQKPVQVEDAMRRFTEHSNANISRSVHTLGAEATEAYEGARAKVAAFIGAPSPDEVVFTKNSTESINLMAYAFQNAALDPSADPRFRIGPGDEIVVTEMEHHANLIPWQQLALRTGATLKWIGITDAGRLDIDTVDEVITERCKVVSFVHVANLLGTVNPTSQITRRAREVGALVGLDASQSVPHLPVDVTELGVDFIAFTGHKMLGPTGIGVLWARAELLDAMPPFLTGGSMIKTVTMEHTTFADAPAKFEAGTPPIAEAVGLAAAVDYLDKLGMANVRAHEKAYVAYMLDRLETVDGLEIIGPRVPIGRGATVSFTFEGVHPHDVGQILDAEGIAVRVGHHCAKPTCERFGVNATTRASGYIYNTHEEIDRLVEALGQVRKVFG